MSNLRTALIEFLQAPSPRWETKHALAEARLLSPMGDCAEADTMWGGLSFDEAMNRLGRYHHDAQRWDERREEAECVVASEFGVGIAEARALMADTAGMVKRLGKGKSLEERAALWEDLIRQVSAPTSPRYC